jgi:hypothetical protein
MSIDKPWHYIHTCGVEFPRGLSWPTLFIDWHSRCTNDSDLSDPVALDHDIDRADRRGSGSIYNGCAPYYQTLIRAITLVTARRSRVYCWFLAETLLG